jgi:glutamate-5-semialdehyde dehydrogenase
MCHMMRETVEATAMAAQAAARSLVAASDAQIDDALEGMATLLEASREPILKANRADVEASSGHMSPGLLDRLRLDEVRLSAIASQVLAMAKLSPVERCAARWRTAEGLEVKERRVPVGVVGAVYESRPNVTADLASQLVKSRNGVLRTGAASMRTAAAMLDTAIAPALADAGVDAEAIGLVRAGGHAAAEGLVSMPTLVPLVILRGSGKTTRHLADIAAAHGVRTLQHADGGGVLYVHARADSDTAIDLIRAGLDRLGVCNRLNWLFVDRSLYGSFLPRALDVLRGLGFAASLPPHDHALSQEWALDRERAATVTVLPVDGVDDALALAHRHTSQLAAAIVSDDDAAATRFLDGYRGTGGFWNATTRWLDGYRLTGAPETGINVDNVPGPRGPVTYRDLHLRQYVVVADRRG